MAEKKLTRSTNKMVSGVCAGIAEYLDVDPTLVRIIYAALTVFSAGFPGVLLYIILLLIMPGKQPTSNNNVEDVEAKEVK